VRPWLASSLMVLALGGLAVLADDRARDKPDSGPIPEAAREETALTFVREHHPELAELLEQLKAMKPDQYQKAIAELAQTSRALANLKKNDVRRYRAALDVWKARSRAELLAAETVGTPGAEQEGRLRAAVENQLAAEIRQQRLDRELLKERLKKLDATIERLETQRTAVVEARAQSLLKKGQRARRRDAGQATPAATAGDGQVPSQKGKD
jgi:hypothetical protein